MCDSVKMGKVKDMYDKYPPAWGPPQWLLRNYHFYTPTAINNLSVQIICALKKIQDVIQAGITHDCLYSFSFVLMVEAKTQRRKA